MLSHLVNMYAYLQIARVYSLPEQFSGYEGDETKSPCCWREPVDCLKSLIDGVPQCCCIIERFVYLCSAHPSNGVENGYLLSTDAKETLFLS